MKLLRRITMAAALPVAAITLAAGPAAATAPPAEPFPGPTGQTPAGWTAVIDDTQSIAIFVPPAWSQVDTVPAQNDDGTPRPWISATTDESAFFPAEGAGDTFSVPGVILTAFPYDPDTASYLTRSVYNDTCTPGPIESYNDGRFNGHIQAFTACGATATTVYQVAASPYDNSFTAHVLIQLTGQPDDAATLDGLLVSFQPYVAPAS